MMMRKIVNEKKNIMSLAAYSFVLLISFEKVDRMLRNTLEASQNRVIAALAGSP